MILYDEMIEFIPYEMRKYKLITDYLQIVADNLELYVESNVAESEFLLIDKMKNSKLDLYGMRYGIVRGNLNDTKMRYEIKRKKYIYDNTKGILDNLISMMNKAGYFVSSEYAKDTTGESLAVNLKFVVPPDGETSLILRSADESFVYGSRIAVEVLQGQYIVTQRTGNKASNRRFNSKLTYIQI